MWKRTVWISLALCTVARAQTWPGERARLELSVVSDAGWPAETAVRLRFDHAAEVAAGRSRADGSDVTLLLRAPDGGLVPRHRVLDTGSDWNRADTELWFKLDAPGDAGALSLSLGGMTAGLDDAREVFLFSDDFEDGAVDDWALIRNTVGTALLAANAGAHRGQFAMVNQPAGSGTFQAVAPLQRVLPLDVVLDAWVFMDDPAGAQWAWFLRFDASRDDSYNFGPDDAANSWRAGQRLGGAYTRYPGSVPFSASPARQWVRVVVGVQGQSLTACVDVACLDGGVVGTTLFLDAGVGFGRLLTSADADGGRRLLIDDVTVRPFVSPEPVVAIARRLAGEGEPCTLDDQCVSGRCVVTCLGQEPLDAGTVDAGALDAGPADSGVDAGGADAGGVGGGAADAGPGPAAGDFVVGCGCGGGGGAFAFLGLLIFARRKTNVAARGSATGVEGSKRARWTSG